VHNINKCKCATYSHKLHCLNYAQVTTSTGNRRKNEKAQHNNSGQLNNSPRTKQNCTEQLNASSCCTPVYSVNGFKWLHVNRKAPSHLIQIKWATQFWTHENDQTFMKQFSCVCRKKLSLYYTNYSVPTKKQSQDKLYFGNRYNSQTVKPQIEKFSA